MGSYIEISEESNIKKDLQRVSEKVEHYYAENKELPILNRYDNIQRFIDSITVNDNSNYYVIDLEKIGGVIGLNLTYGISGYNQIRNMDISQKITDITDVFIVNEKSHIVYYPEGIKTHSNSIIYRLPEVIS